MIIKENSAGIPNIVNKVTVTTLMGIINPKGATIKLYPYRINELIIAFFTTENIFLNILSTSIYVMNIFDIYEISFRSFSAISKVRVSI